MKFPIFFCLFLCIVAARADLAASRTQIKTWSTAENWAEDLQWRKLLHFEPTNFGGLESQVDGSNFFYSPQGSKDMHAELQATLDAFFTPLSAEAAQNERLNPLCRYPARWSWVKRKIAGRKIELPTVECPRFQTFLKTLRGPSVSLVFSSYYLNNPSSAFGHTFIRINKVPAADGRRYELLDYGVNYAANMDTDNALIYAFRGLFGMFRGTFTTTPYYYKVREYNNAESRDLWEYELNVTSESVDHLIEHIWELGPTQINYWYLSENCSYHMFSILEAADANIDLLSKLKKYVIPSDTVQVVWKTPGFVKSVHFRPSIRTELMARASHLSPEEIDEVLYIMKNREVSASLANRPLRSQVMILDTAVDFIDFKYAYEVQIENSGGLKFKNKMLAYRSHLDLISEPLKVEMPELEKPHEAHGSRRAGLGYLSSSEKPNRYLFSYKFALHDQLDPIEGYPEYADITFFNLGMSVEESTHTVQPEDWTLFEVLSTFPLTQFNRDLSWRFRMGSERVRNENCDFCRWSGIFGSAGGTWALTPENVAFLYLGVKGIGAFHEENNIHWWAGAGPEARLRVRWTPQFISLFEAWHRWDLQGTEKVYFERGLSTQYSWKNEQGLRLSFKDYGFDKTISGQFFYYY